MPLTRDLARFHTRVQAERLLGFGMPVVLFFAGLATWLFHSNTGFIVGTGAGSAAGLLATYLILFRQGAVRLSWIMATGLLLGYCGGAVNTDVGLMRESTNLADYFGRSQAELSTAGGVVLWICAGLFAAGGMFESPLVIRTKSLSRADTRLVWMAIGLIVFCFVTGHLVFNGMRESAGNHITVLGDFGSFFCRILPGITIILLGASKWRRRTVLLLLLVLLEFGFLIVLGRRILIYGMLVAFLSGSLVGLRLRLSWTKKLVFGAIAFAVIYAGINFFYAMRVTTWRLAGEPVRLTQLISGGLDALMDKSDTSLQASLAENLRDRTSIIIYLSDLLAATKVYPPLHGKDFLYCVKWVIPSVIYPEKDTSAEEVVTNPQFGMAIDDDPNSVLTSGTCDFGIIGCCAYPFLVVFGFRLLLRLLRSQLSEAAFSVALAAVITLLFQAEAGLPEHTAMAREVVLIGLIITAVKKWPAVGDRNRGADKLLPLRLGSLREPTPVQF